MYGCRSGKLGAQEVLGSILVGINTPSVPGIQKAPPGYPALIFILISKHRRVSLGVQLHITPSLPGIQKAPPTYPALKKCCFWPSPGDLGVIWRIPPKSPGSSQSTTRLPGPHFLSNVKYRRVGWGCNDRSSPTYPAVHPQVTRGLQGKKSATAG